MENFQNTPQNFEPQPKKALPSWLGMAIVVVLAILVGGGILCYQYFYLQNLNANPIIVEIPKNETAGWKTYTNSEYGFEFKYPKDWVIESIKNSDMVNVWSSAEKMQSSKDVAIPIYPEFSVKYWDTNSFKDFASGLGLASVNNAKDFVIAQFPNFAEITIGGKEAYAGIAVANRAVYTAYIDFNGVYVLSAGLSDDSSQDPQNPGLNKDVENIISTFKFIEADETSNWKTYTNTEYGFEFKYPSGFFYWNPKVLIGDCNYNVFPNQCPNINDIVANELIAEGGDANAVQNNILSFPKGEKKEINNEPYCLYKTGDSAAGSYYYDDYYVTIKNQKCFVLRLVSKLTNCGVYGSLGDKQYDDCDIYNKTTYPETFNQVISTFKFTK